MFLRQVEKVKVVIADIMLPRELQPILDSEYSVSVEKIIWPEKS